MTTDISFPVVIPAAGIGSRMAAKKAKQYLSIHNRTIIEHTLALFLSHINIGPIVVVIHPEDRIFAKLPVASNPKIHTVVGGQERVDSVLAGLQHLKEIGHAKQYVLVHDAARPCLDTDDLSNLINKCLQAKANNDMIAGAILACPVTDTIKKSNVGSNNALKNCPIIQSTIDRSELWQAQTPQMFLVDELSCAIETGLALGNKLTDEASAIEFSGKQVLLVEGPSSNLKITRPSDVALASFYLSNRIGTGISIEN